MSDDDIGIDTSLGLGTWGLDAADVAPSRHGLEVKVVRLGWPVGLLCASVCAAISYVAHERGKTDMRNWVDEWTGGPE